LRSQRDQGEELEKGAAELHRIANS
jgi:hypothetical protein